MHHIRIKESQFGLAKIAAIKEKSISFGDEFDITVTLDKVTPKITELLLLQDMKGLAVADKQSKPSVYLR